MLSKILLGLVFVTAILLVIKPPEEDGSNSSKKQEHTHKSSTKSPRLPPYRAPRVDGNTYNLEVVWWKHKGRFLPESVAWTKHDLVNKPGEAHLTLSSEEARIKLRNPKAEVVKVKTWYELGHGTTKCFSWHGQGGIPPIPLSKSITNRVGKVVQANLVEISLYAYDPRFLGPRVKPHAHPGIVDTPPVETEVI